jgi:methyl-accepting chemotaxis protein
MTFNAQTDAISNGKFDSEDDLLIRQCIQFQKRRVFWVGPAMLLLAIGGYLFMPVWQLQVVVGALAVTNLTFWIGLKLAKNALIEKSLTMAMAGTLVSSISVVTMLDGFDAVMLLVVMSLVIQGAMFSKKVSHYGLIGILFQVTIGQLVGFVEMFERYPSPARTVFALSSVVAVIMVLQIWGYIRRHQENSTYFYEQKKALLQRRETILQSVTETIPMVEASVGETADVSNDLSERATTLGGTIESIMSLIEDLIASATSSTHHAEQSARISEGIQRVMQDNFNRLKNVSNQSEDVATNMNEMRKIIGALVSHTDNIEKILSYSRTIGEQIKILSVNASIEAAEAGEFGRGFAVVARELTELIDSTEKNLFETSLMLNDIRRQSNAGMTTVDSATDTMSRFFKDLLQTRNALEKAVGNADRAAQQTRKIVRSATKQQSDLSRVAEGTQTMIDNAFELAVSSGRLKDTIAHLDRLRQSLSNLLGTVNKQQVASDGRRR